MPYIDAASRRPQIVAAARAVLARDGVAKASLRAVAGEAGVPLGTLQHVFPAKDRLLRAVIEDVTDEIARLLEDLTDSEHGLEQAIRTALDGFWSQLVEDQTGLQLMQYELTLYSLRNAGQAELARWQYERYAQVIAGWCERAARESREESPVPFDRLARVILAGMDGLILQHVCDPDPARSRADLDTFVEAVVQLVGGPRGEDASRVMQL